jgi:predicted nucleic acid-binding protein
VTTILIDTNVLIHLLDPKPPVDRKVRLDGLLQSIQDSRGELLIPAQVIGEYLVGAGAAGEPLLDRLMHARFVRIVSYDHRCAVETAMIGRTASQRGHKRWPLGRDTAWQKVNVDRQIVATAKAHAVGIVAEDGHISNIARAAGVDCKSIKDLPVPDSAKQMHIEGVPGNSVIPMLAPSARRPGLRRKLT